MDNSDVPGSNYAPLPKANTLKKLVRIECPKNQNWIVYSYVLNSEISQEDNLYGMMINLGCFPTQKAAEERAEKLAVETGCSIYVSPIAMWIPMKKEAEKRTIIPLDEDGNIVKFQTSEYQRKMKEIEERKKMDLEIIEEKEKELDPEDIEYFKHQCILAIKNNSDVESVIKTLQETEESYDLRVKKLREHLVKHPESEEIWLDHLKKKLESRKEDEFYKFIEREYLKNRDKLLGVGKIKKSKSTNFAIICKEDIQE